jgi:hypothetical protein
MIQGTEHNMKPLLCLTDVCLQLGVFFQCYNVTFSGITPRLYRVDARPNVPPSIRTMNMSTAACAVHVSR